MNKILKNEPLELESKSPHEKIIIERFSSFKEMNEAAAQTAANTEPLVHLQNVTQLIKKLYAEELKKPFDKKIRFK